MQPLALREVHAALGAVFAGERGFEVVDHYGDPLREHAALCHQAGVVDLSFRGRLCLTGTDRVRLLNGQVTNDIKALVCQSGCHAAFCGPKGRLVADAHIYALADELLVEFEPGLTSILMERLEHHIVAEDVQVLDVTPYYGLLSVQGPCSSAVVRRLDWFASLPTEENRFVSKADAILGELYAMRRSRAGSVGYDLFIPTDAVSMVFDKLVTAVRAESGLPVGFQALELARFEAGIPRFGVEMNETHLPPETGLERDAISYTKGCYTGQETIARLRTYGQVSKALRGLQLVSGPHGLPKAGDAIQWNGKNVGQVMSACFSPTLNQPLALAYVRKECNAPGTELMVVGDRGLQPAVVVPLPFGSVSPVVPPAGEISGTG